jgi:hypothetical protein
MGRTLASWFAVNQSGLYGLSRTNWKVLSSTDLNSVMLSGSRPLA